MAWDSTTQKQFFPNQKREGGYGTFGATSTTLNLVTFMSKIHTIHVEYRTSGNSCAYDIPLTASETITNNYFTVTRPQTVGGASTIWYSLVGQ